MFPFQTGRLPRPPRLSIARSKSVFAFLSLLFVFRPAAKSQKFSIPLHACQPLAATISRSAVLSDKCFGGLDSFGCGFFVRSEFDAARRRERRNRWCGAGR